MRAPSTFIKLFLDNLLVMVVIIAMAGLFTYHRLDANNQRESQANQDRLAQMATRHFQALWPMDQAQVDRVCKDLLRDGDIRLSVIAADGSVLGDSQADPSTMANHKTSDRPEVLAALAGQTGRDQRHSGTVGIPYRYVALPLTQDGQVVAAVRLAMPVRTIAEGETVLRNAVLWSALAGTAAAVVLGLIASWTWYRPLRRLTRAAQQIASGDLSSGAGLRAGRLDDLARALNELRDNLGKSLAQIASQHQDFQTVLANLHEGVIATDPDGRVVFMNAAAGRLLSTDEREAAGQPLTSVVPMVDVLDFHEQARIADQTISHTAEIDTPLGRRHLELRGSKVEAGSSTIRCLLMLSDVTDAVRAGAMKTQFVANASHELRTPLATIRAAVDSLLEMDPSDRQELAKLTGMLDRHVRRLEEMTNDLLDLHMVESAKLPLRLQEVPLGELARWVQEQFTPPAQAKGVQLTVEAAPPDHPMRTDRRLLELILRNLLDNAIKFTPAGGSIQCVLEAADQGVRLRVNDTGCGISPEDQRRVFERFYRVDKARTGASGTRGTGLGLAIVKHAADRLGAKVELTSQPGRGTTVEVSIVP